MRNLSRLALILLIASSVTACNSGDSDSSTPQSNSIKVSSGSVDSTTTPEESAEKSIELSELDALGLAIIEAGCNIAEEFISCRDDLSLDEKKQLVRLFNEYIDAVELLDDISEYGEVVNQLAEIKLEFVDEIRDALRLEGYHKALTEFNELGCEIRNQLASCTPVQELKKLREMFDAATRLKVILNYVDVESAREIQQGIQELRVELNTAVNFYVDLEEISYFYRVDRDESSIQLTRRSQQLARPELVLMRNILSRLSMRARSIHGINGSNYRTEFLRELVTVKASL